jgi:hypothetical protein
MSIELSIDEWHLIVDRLLDDPAVNFTIENDVEQELDDHLILKFPTEKDKTYFILKYTAAAESK